MLTASITSSWSLCLIFKSPDENDSGHFTHFLSISTWFDDSWKSWSTNNVLFPKRTQENKKTQPNQPKKDWFQKNTTLQKVLCGYKSRFLSQDYKFNTLTYLQHLIYTHTVALCSAHSSQNLLAENFRLKIKVFPLRKQVPTPMPPPAVWYKGKVQYMMSSGVMAYNIGTVPNLKNL